MIDTTPTEEVSAFDGALAWFVATETHEGSPPWALGDGRTSARVSAASDAGVTRLAMAAIVKS